MRRPRKMVLAATTAIVFVWPAAFVAFAATTVAAPSVTDGAGVGRAAFWALQVAVLIAIVAAATTLRRHTAEPDPAGGGPPTRVRPLRVVGHLLVSTVTAALVLAPQGLSAAQIALLTVVLLVVLHLLPMVVARLLLRRRRGRRPADPSDGRA
ncbi:hypothetical protein [Plantactinospora sp. B5E13]|uniref:hypothetical protein n=1 Tax=Plantactinospora sp. B5E13 TaxID=3153758 RepID=UPI00325FBBC0